MVGFLNSMTFGNQIVVYNSVNQLWIDAGFPEYIRTSELNYTQYKRHFRIANEYFAISIASNLCTKLE